MGWRKMRKRKVTETAHQTEDGCGGPGCRKLGLVRRDRVTTDMLKAGVKADTEGSSSVMVLCYSQKAAAVFEGHKGKEGNRTSHNQQLPHLLYLSGVCVCI